jgi:hypothetical protein
VWNRVARAKQDQIVENFVEHSALLPRELVVRFTDESQYFVPQATVCGLLEALHHLGPP